MDRFASVAAFVQVIESGGFSAAGRHLNLSKARVSHQIQALENALGVRLLNRSTRRISLTEAGRGYYERCVKILQDLEEADEAAGAQQATPRGQLRVYCQQGIVQFVAPVIVDFLARYPEASVDLRTGHAMIDLVQEAFDLAISAQPTPDSTLCQTAPRDVEPDAVCRPGLFQEAFSAANSGGSRRPQLPALPLRTVRGRVALSGCWRQSGDGTHIGEPDQ